MQRKKLNLFEKGQIVALIANGESYRSVSRKMVLYPTTISRVWKRFIIINMMEVRRVSKYGSGRKKKFIAIN